MSTKNTRSGDKYCGSHTTIIPAATTLADIAHDYDEVSKISLGIIEAGLSPVSGQRRVRFADDLGSILIRVRDNTTLQELRIYTSDVNQTRTKLARESRNLGFRISFRKPM